MHCKYARSWYTLAVLRHPDPVSQLVAHCDHCEAFPVANVAQERSVAPCSCGLSPKLRLSRSERLWHRIADLLVTNNENGWVDCLPGYNRVSSYDTSAHVTFSGRMMATSAESVEQVRRSVDETLSVESLDSFALVLL